VVSETAEALPFAAAVAMVSAICHRRTSLESARVTMAMAAPVVCDWPCIKLRTDVQVIVLEMGFASMVCASVTLASLGQLAMAFFAQMV